MICHAMTSSMNRSLILTILFIPVCTSACSNTLEADTKGGRCLEQFSVIGTDVILRCDSSDKTNVVTWWVNGTVVVPNKEVVVNDNSLMLRNASLSQEGEYTCHQPETGETLGKVHLQMGYPPGRPLIKCLSPSYPESVRCTWKLEMETHLHTHFIASYRYGMAMNEEVRECAQPVPQESSCIIKDIQLFSVTPYTVNVTAVNPLGSASNLQQFIVENIIKPDPPEEVTVSQIKQQSRKLYLQWKPPSSWPAIEYFPLKYRIRYRQDGTTMLRMIGPYEQTSFTLAGLRPRTMYHIEVSAKDFTDSGEESDWSPVVSATPWRR